MIYYKTPNHSLALIPKSGCSTMARCVIKNFYPDTEYLIQNAAYPEGKGPDSIMWQSFAPKEKHPSKPTVALIRNPVDRFVSAMSQVNLMDVDAAIYSMLNGTDIQMAKGKLNISKNSHFRLQVKWLVPDTKLYRFPDHLQEAAIQLGMQIPLPVVNAASRPKPTLTPQQQQIVEQYYAEDIVLYDSIVSPGIVTGIVWSQYQETTAPDNTTPPEEYIP